MTDLIRIAIGLIIAGCVFTLLETLWPSRLKQRKWRQGIRTDLMYWVFTPRVTKSIARVAILIALLPAVALLGKEHVQQAIVQGHGPIAQWPASLQVIGVIVIGDFLGYWVHRLFHRPTLWRYHAVHHSSTELDWLSSVRLHPVNDVLTRLAQAIPILLLGFPAMIIAMYIPFHCCPVNRNKKGLNLNELL